MAMTEVKNSLPEHINVMRLVTYNIQRICEDIHESLEKPFEEITMEDCLSWIEDWVAEDFGSTRGLLWQDENGNDL